MKSIDSLFIFAGELSGDLHGGNLLRAMKIGCKETFKVSGVAGPELRNQGVTGPLQMEDFMVMGFSDVLKSLPRILWQFRQVRNHILETNPDVAVFIDSPSFSLPMAKSLRKAGYKGKIVQYISPTVWAWGKKRIQKIADSFDLLLTVYPFEAQCFVDTSLRVEYVGNPLREAIKNYQYNSDWKTLFGIEPAKKILALFPGSRKGEISRNLSSQLEAAKMLCKLYPETLLAISCAHENSHEIIQQIVEESGLKINKEVFFIPKAYSYDLMRDCHSAIAKSGTVTLELALHECPTVVTYKLSKLNKWVAQYVLKVNLPHYCIVNILKQACVFPELITNGCLPKDILNNIIPLFASGPARETCITQCKDVQNLLQENDSSVRAAQAIQEIYQ